MSTSQGLWSPSPFPIRRATRLDRKAIQVLYRLSQQETNIPPSLWYPSDTLNHIIDQRPCLEAFVAESAGLIVAHGLLGSVRPDHPIYTSGLADPEVHYVELGLAMVHPAYFRRGLYTALLGLRLAQARDLGLVALSATWTYNLPVERLFQRFGGRKIITEQAPPLSAHTLGVYLFDN